MQIKRFFSFSRYDSGQNILKSDLCDSSSNNCPMKTKYATFTDVTVGDTFDWDDVNDTIPNRVYALHYSTVESKCIRVLFTGCITTFRHTCSAMS